MQIPDEIQDYLDDALYTLESFRPLATEDQLSHIDADVEEIRAWLDAQTAQLQPPPISAANKLADAAHTLLDGLYGANSGETIPYDQLPEDRQYACDKLSQALRNFDDCKQPEANSDSA